MGASGWQYFMPYQSDIQKALEELRAQVFQSGKYYIGEPVWQNIDESEYDEYPEEDMREELKEWLRRMKSLKEPATIDDLLEWNGEEGTHSILDIKSISVEPDFGTISPLLLDELMSLFGTDKPTKDMVEQKADHIMDLRERWQGTYIIIYKAEQPSEIFFTGFSGD
jgi:hypothetical protein